MAMKLAVVCLLFVFVLQAFSAPPTQEAWDAAVQKAKDYITTKGLNNTEKAIIATGVGWEGGACVGNIAAIPRVNFTGFCLEDSPTGVRFAQGVSGFPAGINIASTWNRTQMYARSYAMGYEFRTKGVHIALTPMMNLGRVAAGGRNWEGFGADPYLAGEAAYQSVMGIQDQGVIATAKHYLLNEQEHFRTSSSSNVDNRTLHELYLWPFIQSVKAGVGSVMCSYNLVNGVYACENEHILTQVLKNELGFQGYVMSDWAATMSGVPSANAGLDMNMPGDVTFNSGTSYWGKNLVDAVASGKVAQSRLDDMVIRILTPYFLFAQDQAFPNVDFDFRNKKIGNKRNAQADHANLIRQIGADSNILLKNKDNVLPFASTAMGDANYTFAVIGSDAGSSPGSYGPSACGDHGCNIGTLAQGWGSGTVWFPYLIDPNAAITSKATLNGQTVVSSLTDNIVLAQSAAANASIALVFVSADSGEGYITVEGNEGDRNDLNLWHNGNSLIQAVASVNSRTVVVIHTVGPVLMPWASHPNVSAIIVAGLPGQESGNSLADVLFGAVNPSAKLIYTVAQQPTDYSASVLYKSSAKVPQINYAEKLLIDYRWFDQNSITPLFEFGYGLSYTTFTYNTLQFTPVSSAITTCVVHQTLENEVAFIATVYVRNTGNYDGAEVVQLYLAFPTSAGEPPKVLRGFDKVWVAKGASAQASFSLTRMDVSIWDSAVSGWVVPAGTFQVMIGASSRDIRLNISFDVQPLPTVSFSTTSYTVVEGNSINITLALSASSMVAISVPLAVKYNTATASDVTLSSACVTFAPNTLNAQVVLKANDVNSIYQASKSLSIVIQTPTNANMASISTIASVVILDNDTPQVSTSVSYNATTGTTGQQKNVSESTGAASIYFFMLLLVLLLS